MVVVVCVAADEAAADGAVPAEGGVAGAGAVGVGVAEALASSDSRAMDGSVVGALAAAVLRPVEGEAGASAAGVGGATTEPAVAVVVVPAGVVVAAGRAGSDAPSSRSNGSCEAAAALAPALRPRAVVALAGRTGGLEAMAAEALIGWERSNRRASRR